MAYRLQYSDYITTASGPPDPERWIGPPGPPGPVGPQGSQGVQGIPGASTPISGTLPNDLIMATGTGIGLDTAASSGLPYMQMFSDGGNVNFTADTWPSRATTGSISFRISGNPGASEYWGTTGGLDGQGASLKVYTVLGGHNPNGLISTTGTGQLMFGNDNGTILNLQGPVGSLASNYVQVSSSATGSAPVVAAAGSDTDIALVVGPKGAGPLQSSGVIAANPRGTYAIDWQRNRSVNTQIASGAQAVIGGGSSNSASATFSSVGGGFLNNADGYASTIPGGFRAWARGQYGWLGFSSGVVQGVTEGDAQGSWRILRGTTTASAPVRLTADGLAASTVAPNINSVYISNSLCVAMTITIVGMDRTVTTSRLNSYFNDVTIGRSSTGGTQIFVGASPRTYGFDIPAVAITVGAEGMLSVVVTPATANTWHFVAKISAVEVN